MADGVEPADIDSPAATASHGPATRSVTFKYEGGLVDYVAYLTSAKKVELVHPNVIDFTAEDTERRISVEIAMQWTNAYSESVHTLSLIHISEPTRLGMISYAVFCLKKKNLKT